MIIGVISDTHGLLRPEAVAALRGVDRIIHAGDIGAPEVLYALAAVAPVTAVRGNNDRESWASAIAHTQVVDAGGVLIYVIHDVAELDVDPVAGGFGVVIAGHSHKPLNEAARRRVVVQPRQRRTAPLQVAHRPRPTDHRSGPRARRDRDAVTAATRVAAVVVAGRARGVRRAVAPADAAGSGGSHRAAGRMASVVDDRFRRQHYEPTDVRRYGSGAWSPVRLHRSPRVGRPAVASLRLAG